MGCITRLVPQKGIHLIRHAIYRTLELGGQFVLLGSSPIPHIQVIYLNFWAYVRFSSTHVTRSPCTHLTIAFLFLQREFEGIANNFQSHDQVRLVLAYDESLSHWIYAGSDMLIIPSIFEPCGLTQVTGCRCGLVWAFF